MLYKILLNTIQSDHGASQARRCPHCGLVWLKIEGCDGNTNCGERPSAGNDARDASFLELATFNFDTRGGGLRITRAGTKRPQRLGSGGARVGCGRTINWSTMAPVEMPPEFSHTPTVKH